LTRRSETVRHGGQISLPGGVVEPGETFEHAALREAHEEIGLSLGDVRTIGALTPLDIPVSGFRLHPIVGAMDEQPRLRAADQEVAGIIQAPLADFFDRAHLVWRTMMRDGHRIRFPAFVVKRAEIWGATAMVFSEFLTLLGWDGPQGVSPLQK
jgi:8-oxo-dGTP pyrophosphatase MutT (NUDIX family)